MLRLYFMKIKLLIILLSHIGAISTQCWAGSVHIDLGETQTNFNRFSIPSDAQRITTPNDKSLVSTRFTAYINLPSNNQIYFLYAPLDLSYRFIAQNNFVFNNTDFLANKETDIDYKFNSYRVGYLWSWRTSNFRYWFGIVGKIRDAQIKVSQSNRSDSYDNIGFVPLAALGFELAMNSNLGIFHHTDALGAPQGSAYDSQIELKYKVGDFSISSGKRILGGGADNSKVYNFAQFDSYYLRISSYF